jgi:23S rRNA (cytidine1920-2'-O)/16S rRNA (cytidine1409-2'-O)-methyltransferase
MWQYQNINMEVKSTEKKNTKKRLDSEIARRKLARSRTAAQMLIRNEKVLVNGKMAEKVGELVGSEDVIEVTENLKFVSRGGLKLEAALVHFGIDAGDKIALDIGSSTGGFTDCLLQRGARQIYAIDVGTDQMDKNLRTNPKVILRESTDIREVKRLEEHPDLAAIDVSFISLSHILPYAYKLLRTEGVALALVKPQFELGRAVLNKRGIVESEKDRLKALEKVKTFALISGFKIVGEAQSPIAGGDGNIEYFLCLQKLNERHVGSGLVYSAPTEVIS